MVLLLPTLQYVQKRLPPGEPLQQPSAAAPHPGTDGAAAPRRSRLAGSEPAKALLQPAAHAAVAGANCSGPTAPIVAGGDRYERLLAEAELCIRARSASPLMRPLTPQCDTRSGGAGASCAAGADESSPAPRSRLADASRAVAAVMLPPPLLLPAAAAATTSVFLVPALIPSKDAPASVVLAMPAAASTSSCGPPPGMAGQCTCMSPAAYPACDQMHACICSTGFQLPTPASCSVSCQLPHLRSRLNARCCLLDCTYPLQCNHQTRPTRCHEALLLIAGSVALSRALALHYCACLRLLSQVIVSDLMRSRAAVCRFLHLCTGICMFV